MGFQGNLHFLGILINFCHYFAIIWQGFLKMTCTIGIGIDFDIFIFVSHMFPVWLQAQPKLSDTRCTKWIAEQPRSCNGKDVENSKRSKCETSGSDMWKKTSKVGLIEKFLRKVLFCLYFSSVLQKDSTRECKTLHRLCGYVQNLGASWVQEQR